MILFTPPNLNRICALKDESINCASSGLIYFKSLHGFPFSL